MRAITTQEARQWCSSANLAVGRYTLLRFKHSGEHKFFITAPEEHRLITVLAYQIVAFRGETHFSGGLLWLQRWEIGSPQLVRPGWLILESMRRAHGELRSLESAPVQIFREDEPVELHAFLLQAIAFGWVTDYVPAIGRFFLHFKDNRQICFTAESQDTLKDLREEFQRWNPTDDDPMLVKMAEMEKVRKRSAK